MGGSLKVKILKINKKETYNVTSKSIISPTHIENLQKLTLVRFVVKTYFYIFKIKTLLSYFFLYIFILINCLSGSISVREIDIKSNKIDFINKYSIQENLFDKLKSKRRTKTPTALVIHTSDDYSVKDFFENSLKNGFFFHIFIDKAGILYVDNLLNEYRLTPKMDAYAIHIVLEGKEADILGNTEYLGMIVENIKKVSNAYQIPLDNKDIASERGIFTHTQSKKKYGNFVDMRDCGGEKLLSAIINQSGGTYYNEIEWKDRFTKEWTFRKEDIKSIKTKEDFTHGRGITENPISAIKNIEKTPDDHLIEEFRVKYVFDEKINPTCVVLHFTALSDFKTSLKVLEDRRVNATIMVDKDGKAYQLLDSIYHSPRTAGGTNSACIQIEIVGKNTEELLKNEIQTQKVILLVQELTKLFSIPITNQKIESLSGVFSHTQAKKKFGRSVALVGKDFDPGEEYMKKVIEALGAKYYSEEEWFDRKSEDWIILYGDFQP